MVHQLVPLYKSQRLINSYTSRVKLRGRSLVNELQPNNNKKKPNELCLTIRFSRSAQAAFISTYQKTLAITGLEDAFLHWSWSGICWEYSTIPALTKNLNALKIFHFFPQF